MNDLTQAPSNVSSVSVRIEDGLIIEEVINEVTIDAHVQQQQQQEMATSSSSSSSNHNKTTPNTSMNGQNNKKQNKNKKFFSFFNNHQNTTTSPLKSTNTPSTKTNNNSTITKGTFHNNNTSSDAITEDDELTIMDLPSPEDIVGNNHNRNSLHSDGDLSSLSVDGKEGNNYFFGVGGGTQPQAPGMHAQCKRSLYGHPVSIPELKEYFDFKEKEENGSNGAVDDDAQDKDEIDLWEEGGLVWYSHIVPDDFDAQFTTKGTLKMLPKKFYDETTHSIKPRRGTLSIRESDFFTSLVKINTRKDKKNINHNKGGGVEVSVRHDGDEYDEGYADDDSDFKIFDSKLKIFDDYSSVGDGVVGDTTEVYVQNKAMKQQHSKWFFSGVLNGWPGLKHLELVKIEYKLNVVPGWRSHWDTEMNPKDKAPTFPTKVLGLMEVRAKLREPGWSAQGWAKDSPGYVMYYNQVRKEPRVLYGTNIIRQFEKDRENEAKKVGWNNFHVPHSPKCVRVHMISHRYATSKEKWKDKISYHSFALLEWDHGKHCTVIELAFLNGLGGYNARCNHTEVRYFLWIDL